jgi:universal stress protein E
MRLTDILVIADREDRQQNALRAALALVRDAAARIQLVGFVHDATIDNPNLMSASAGRRLQAAMLKDKRTWLEEAAKRLAQEGAEIAVTVVWCKDISAWVKENVSTKTCNLIVKSGNRSENVLYTPTDWRLLREGPVPVLIARDKLRRRPSRVLATIDLGASDAGQKALNKRVLQAASGIAGQLGAELHVVYAIPVSALAQDLDLVDSRALERRTRRKLAREIAELAEDYGLPPAHIVIKAGPPERVVDGVASKLKAALVVMGTIGRKGLKGRLLGNTAEKVLHSNRSNLLALRPDT